MEGLDGPILPALLTSFVYLDRFEKVRSRLRMRGYALDSGAFSAKNSGVTLDLQEYIETCQRLLATDPLLIEVFALDVIDDWRASTRNTELMWAAGIPAIPAYHIGEPESVLRGLARDYPKIALGGVARTREATRHAFAKQCFARVWPHRIHGFGYGSQTSAMLLPWHSVDATSWEIRPCGFGTWCAFPEVSADGNRKAGKMSVRGSQQNLRAEVEFYLAVEREARQRWAKETRLVEAITPKREVGVPA